VRLPPLIILWSFPTNSFLPLFFRRHQPFSLRRHHLQILASERVGQRRERGARRERKWRTGGDGTRQTGREGGGRCSQRKREMAHLRWARRPMLVQGMSRSDREKSDPAAV
jgi:hypothetical protein